MKINKSLAPLMAGSERTALSVGVANALVDGANAINAMRGDGEGIKVTHSDSNIVVDLGCPMPRDYSVNRTFPYYHHRDVLSGDCIASLEAPPVVTTCIDYFTLASTNRVAAEFTFDLYDTFPYLDETYSPPFFWDNKPGTPSISSRTPQTITAFPQTQVDAFGNPAPGVGLRDHPYGALTIGPFTKRMIVFTVTDLSADDILAVGIDGALEVGIFTGLTPYSKNLPLAYIPKGSTARFRVLERGGAYVWAAGIVGVKAVHCCPKEWRTAFGI